MRKIISLLLALSMLLSLAVSMGLPVAAAPEGIAIRSAADFAAMSPDGTYYLAKNITLDAAYAQTFSGTFDGNGKTVTITNGAMFLTVEDATIKNLTVAGKIETAAPGLAVSGNDFAAAVTVMANGTSKFQSIIVNVDFKTTSENTRYGAIAGTSAEGYALTFENCVNNGTINVVKYAGGIYGWTSKKGNAVFTDCVNTGNITAGGYCAGIVCRISAANSHMNTVTITDCVNKGDITSSEQYCGGIYGYSESMLTITGCINYGAISANSTADNAKNNHSGGIIGRLGRVAQNAADARGKTHLIKSNINFGDVSNTADKSHTGGIVGYVYASSTNYFAVVEGNINFGTISGKEFTSQILAYTNANETVIRGNVGAGKVVSEVDEEAVLIALGAADATKYTIENNYLAENDGTEKFSWSKNEQNAKSCVELNARAADSLTFVAADALASAEVINALNEVLGAEIFTVKDGKISLTVGAITKEKVEEEKGLFFGLFPLIYRLRFETNGGSTIATQLRMLSNAVKLDRFTPTREGYTFTGWFADPALTVPISEFRMRGNRTVYAGWEEIPVEIVEDVPTEETPSA